MSIFDTNLLDDALDIIGRQDFLYFAFDGRTTNDIGLDVATYLPSVAVSGSFQPVPRYLYAQLGIDLQKNYANFYVPQNVIDIERDTSGDQFTYGARRFQAISRTDWHAVDGWVAVLAVEVLGA